MKRILDEYEKTIEGLDMRIKELKRDIEQERNIVKVHSLERRIDLLRRERRELIAVVVEINKHLAPKPVHPSLLKRNRAV